MIKKKMLKEALTLILALAIVSTQIVLIVHADTPAEPHAADAIWVEPLLIDLSTPPVSVGYKFNVTVFINLTVSSASWEFRLAYNKNHLNATRAGYTAGDKSDFFRNLVTLPLSPTFGAINATHNSVLSAESWMMGPTRSPGYGSLSWVEFQVMTVPPSGETYMSMIALSDVYPEGSQETYVQQPDGTKVALNAYSSTYRITAPGGPAVKYTLNVTSTVGGSTNVSGVFQYDNNTIVYILVTANSGYTFSNWLLDGTNAGSANPIQITMNASYNLRAIFTPTGPTNYDVNGDGKVRIDDVFIAAQSFNSRPGHPRWNPKADINGDGMIRVDDVLAVALHFGLNYP
jgi:hypothetical protein